MAKLEKQSASPPPGQLKHDDHHIGTLDASSYQGAGDPHPGEMWFNFPGSGNLPTNYNISVDDKTDIELGLKITIDKEMILLRRRLMLMERRTMWFRMVLRLPILPTTSRSQTPAALRGVSISR
jgi:hypothetical protein